MQTSTVDPPSFEDESTNSSAIIKTIPHDEVESQQQPQYQQDDEDSDGSDDFQPRIVQVTNFQQQSDEIRTNSPTKSGKIIKQELKTDIDLTENENIPKQIEKQSANINEEEEVCDDKNEDDIQTLLKGCKPSLFTKQPRRQWPWLIERRLDDKSDEEGLTEEITEIPSNNNNNTE